MRIILLCIVALLLASPALAGESLVLGYGGGSLSVESLKVLKEAYERIGVKVEGRRMPAARSLEMADTGQVDGDVNRIEAIEEQYPNLIRVDVPVNLLEGIVLTCNTSLEHVNPEAISKLHLGIKIGNRYAEMLTQDMPDVTKLPYEKKLMALLLEGRLDALLVDRAWAKAEMAKPGMECLRINEPPLVVVPLYHYLNRRHKDLVPMITGELRAMRESGEIDRILGTTAHR
ncbi:transporter substrate-binding domain-containing protein [uncultured Pseudodesulfovibrio sp.]|uniref:substrate-binding periplasmic protein n=1 Tax=uncultured Pseudodesulfovibrio sp. TaxID=2035858 RepID=UPI0029C8DF08|nr:transporter substrate-binding domain-containing protein [uncultured Pseudodesulfovibrio sp.]